VSGEDAVGAIFYRSKGKAKRDGDADEGASNHSGRKKKKKKNKQQRDSTLIAVADPKGKKATTEETPDHFEKMLEGPCPNHRYPIKHAYKDCGLLKKFLGKKGAPKKNPEPSVDDAEDKEDPPFPLKTGCLMIFGSPDYYASKKQRKLERREVFQAEPTTPTFLDRFDHVITFDRSDHPNYIPRSGCYPLLVDPVVGMTHLSKVLMDEGSGLNILYTSTLDAMGIHWD
jgi:hypothetical protein